MARFPPPIKKHLLARYRQSCAANSASSLSTIANHPLDSSHLNMLSCSLAMSNSVMYFDEMAGPSQLPFMNFYYSTGPEYVHEEADDKSSIKYTFNDYSPSSYSPYPDSQSVSSYCTEPLDSPNFIGEDDFFAIPFESTYCNIKQEMQCEAEERQMQIQQNEQIARLLSPFRKFQERLHEQQTRKHAENARRKFSLTNGMRQKRRSKLDLNRPTQKPNVSVRRWKTEIVSKLKGHEFSRQKPAPIALPTGFSQSLNCPPVWPPTIR